MAPPTFEIINALNHMYGAGVNLGVDENDLNIMCVSSLLTCCTVDECVSYLKTAPLDMVAHRLSDMLCIAYSNNMYACVEVLMKCYPDLVYANRLMSDLFDNEDDDAAKHFIAHGYNLRHADSLPEYAFNSKQWLKMLMEDADGMHLLFKPLSRRQTPLQHALKTKTKNKQVCQYLQQLQFLSSFNILTSQQRHSHFHKRGRMDGKQPMKNMPLDMFRLIGAMLV